MNHPDAFETPDAANDQSDHFASHDPVETPSLPDLQLQINNDVHGLVGEEINKVTSLQDALNPSGTPRELSSVLAA